MLRTVAVLTLSVVLVVPAQAGAAESPLRVPEQVGWGLTEAMGLAALLLAECGREEDVWTLWEAKNASFDTMAGLDGFLLFPAGIAGTTAHVIAGEDHPERGDLMTYLSEYLEYEKLTDEDIREHMAALRSHYVD